MTRAPDLHERFGSWLATARVDPDDPPRDLALHAAGCERCLRLAAAADTLLAVDIGAAPPPMLPIPTTSERPRVARAGRVLAAAGAMTLLAGAIAYGATMLGSAPTRVAENDDKVSEGILAGVPSATPTGDASFRTELPSPSPTATPARSDSPSPTEGAATAGGTNAPAQILVPTLRPLPTARPTVAPTVAPTLGPTIPPPPPSVTSPPSPSVAPSPTIVPPLPTPTLEPPVPSLGE